MMLIPTSIFVLPTSLLLLIVTAPVPNESHELEWPYNLPPHVKYFPEDERVVRREISLQKRLQQQPVVGMRKMSTDPEEKFYLDYWSFEPDADDHNFDSWTNTSSSPRSQPCSPLHSNQTLPKVPRHIPFSLWGRSSSEKRDFQCPSGTVACSSIGYPDSCCPSGETCQIVQDTGLGNVGCCPAGEICAGSLSSCSAGQTPCPNNPGGGCCIAGYACLDVGCVYTGTATVVVTPTSTSTYGASTTTLTITTVITPALLSASPTTVTSTTVIVPVPSPVSTITPQYSTTSTTSTSTVPPVLPSPKTTSAPTTSTTTDYTIICSSGFKSCPSSLGGGCCPTDRACASGYCPALSSTDTPIAPVRPTTDSTTTTAPPITGCPTGFYACSAYYQGGCCQVGRDCAKTSCPTSVSTTLISGSVATIVAPAGSGISTAILSGSVCATGWKSCAASDGGGCCPTGFSCGVSCTATANGGGTTVTAKETPQSSAVSVHGTVHLGMIALFGALAVVVLL